VLAVIVAGLGLAVPTAPAVPPVAPVAPVAPVEARPCPVAVPAGTTCGFLLVPQRRDVPDGRMIKVGYAVHRSTAADRKPDPIVYSSGGPGSPSLQLTGFLVRAPFGRDRDVVVIEQRGSRLSEPHLRCPEVERSLLDSLSRPGRDAAEAEALTAAARTCKARLTADGDDLRGYTTAEIAADVIALRSALGYRSWNLFGVSYSTRSMLAAAAADPAGTRSVVLDSFLPAQIDQYDAVAPNLRAALDRVTPGLSAKLLQVVQRLNRHPVSVPITDPLTGGRRTLHLTGDDVGSLIGEGMQDPDVVTAVPALVQALVDGRDDLLGPVGQVAAQLLGSHDLGLYYAVNCQDEVPFNTFGADTGPRSLFSDTDPAVCRGLALPPGSDAPGATDAPVLVVGGTFDAATPVAAARTDASARLPRSTVVEFAGVSHAVFLTNRCGRETIAAFLDAPAGFTPPCDPAVSPYRTLQPGERYLTTRAYALATGPWWTVAAPAALVIVCLLAVVLGALRRRPTLILAGLAGAGALGTAAWLLVDVAATNPASLLVGVPWTVAWCAVLAGALPAAIGLAVIRRGVVPGLLAATSAAYLLWWFTG
jgi:pimeloyl-ACP methyl ester carboxylesterase